MKKYIFLDRDGVINQDPGTYVTKKEEVHILPKVKEALSLLKENNFTILVMTNQAGIGKGMYTEETLQEIHTYLQKECENPITKFYFCPHHPTKAIKEDWRNCSCRKPLPGMLLQAKKEFEIEAFAECFFIGDKDTDVEAGKAAGCKTILIKGIYPAASSQPDHHAKDLYDAVTRIVLK